MKKETKLELEALLDNYQKKQLEAKIKQKEKQYEIELYLENFKEYFGDKTLLANIRYIEVETYRNHLRHKPITVKKGDKEIIKGIRTDAAVNREMSCLHHIFTKAVEWEMMEQSPFDRGKSLRLKENNKRLRFLTEDEIPALLDACAKYLRWIVDCAIMTGMRRGEILNLRSLRDRSHARA